MKAIKAYFIKLSRQLGLAELAPLIFGLCTGIGALISNKLGYGVISLLLLFLTLAQLIGNCYSYSVFRTERQKILFSLYTIGLTMLLTVMLTNRYWLAGQVMRAELDEILIQQEASQAYIRGMVHAIGLQKNAIVCHTEQGNYQILFEQEQPYIITPAKQKLWVTHLQLAEPMQFSSEQHYSIALYYPEQRCRVMVPADAKAYQGRLQINYIDKQPEKIF